MLILSVESSCDETAVAVVRDGREVLSDMILSQVDLHAVYGGVVPEIASRSHLEGIAALTDRAVEQAGVSYSEIDAVAVTYAPGLIGALLVGVNFAKGLALALGKPLIPVHHLRGHIAANYITYPELEPPFMALVVSGGNTAIVDVQGYTDFLILGATRDDAAGECFDKTARVLGLGYPGGKVIDTLAADGNDLAYELPRAKVDGHELDMSFSGLKTSVINTVHNAEQRGIKLDRASLAASLQRAISDTLVPRTVMAAKQKGRTRVVACGGVAANSRIRSDLEKSCRANGLELYLPSLKLCGDNGAMIGCQGYYEYLAGNVSDLSLNAVATLNI